MRFSIHKSPCFIRADRDGGTGDVKGVVARGEDLASGRGLV